MRGKAFEIIRGEALRPWPERSVGALLASRAERFGDKDAIRFRTRSGRWQELSFRQLDFFRRVGAAALAELGVRKGDRVAIVAPNGVAVYVAELALLSLGAVSVPVFADYAPELLAHCLRDSGARIALCGTTGHQHKVEQAAPMDRIVVLDEAVLPSQRALSVVQTLDTVRQLPDGEREARIAAADQACASVQLDDPAWLLYTSGTSGRPKGVELTHRNVLSQQAAIAQVWNVTERDVFLGYLPWHHCFGGLFERFMALWNGSLFVVDDSRGRDLDRLIANFRDVKPTVYFSVPRVYQALVARAIADPAVRDAVLHPRLRFVFTAAAPLSAPCYRFFEDAGIPVHEGWGLTETSPCATLTSEKEPREAGVAGWPLPDTEVRLARVEQASGDAAGEVLVRGPQVMRGYHRAPEETRRAVTEDGFLRSGDIGEWTEHGLRVRGRVDDVFKLENGEKVPAAAVEARVLASSPLLEQAVVLGPGQPHVTALCWISLSAARAWAETHGYEAQSLGDLVRLPELRRAVTEALQSANLLAPVPYERVRRVALVPLPLSLETGELTPTQKVVRSAVIRRHAALIEALTAGAPHDLALDIVRAGDAFQNA